MFKNFNPGALGIQATLLEGLSWAQSAGFDGHDLIINDAVKLAKEHSVEYVKELFENAGLAFGAWFPEVNWRGDESRFYSDLAGLRAKAQLANKLGCRRVITFVGPAHDERSFAENWKFHIRRLRPIAQILNDYGIRFGLEFLGPATNRADRKYGFVHSMDAMLGLCAAIGTGNMGLLFDVWHWYTSHATLNDIRHLTNDDIVAVHISDAPEGIAIDEQIDTVRKLPGETGIIPACDVLRILDDIGYDGPVTAEPFSKKLLEIPPEQAAQKAFDMLDTVWKSAGLSRRAKQAELACA
jgi:sugar phosphate isomerase/epimerase